ncbi:hypothetical protein BGX24_007773 [Mortierella sp. AD032]|nr:hypothetical protein BGX24_007773 [Mortierella sp. AD032]
MSGVSLESRRVVPARSRSVSTVSESGSRQSNARRQLSLATPRPTPTPPLLKRDSSISTVLYRSSQDTEADWSSAVSHIDEVESDSSQSRISAMRSRESSMTPPITSMAQAMSISGHGQALQRPQRPQRSEQSAGYDMPKRSIKQSTAQLHRRSSSLSGSDLTRDEPERQQYQQKHNRDNNPEAPIYPQTLTSRSRTHSGNRKQARVVDDSPPAAFTDSVNNPFIASSGNPSPAQESRTPSPSSNIDNASFTALVQQVTAMREQLASLLAEKEIHQRTYSAPASLSPGAPPPPPPPPPFPQTPSSKMRTPPVNEATRSMAMVLNELSTSKVHLRKTDSPFLSRISSAIDSSPNSRFSRVVFRSRLDMISDNYSGSSATGSTAPLSLVSHLRGPSNGTSLNGSASQPLDRMPLGTPVKRGIQPIFQEPEEEEEEELSWPSPGTVRQADSRLEVAAKSLSQKQDGMEQAAVSSRSGGLKTKRAEDKADYGTPRAHNLVEGKRKWTSRTSCTTETEIGEVTPAAGTNVANARAESEEVILSSGALSMEGGVFGRERSGPRLDDNNKRHRRPARPRSMVLSRSMTDPTTLHSSSGISTATPTMTIADKEKERQWFLESDMDGWKVAN